MRLTKELFVLLVIILSASCDADNMPTPKEFSVGYKGQFINNRYVASQSSKYDFDVASFVKELPVISHNIGDVTCEHLNLIDIWLLEKRWPNEKTADLTDSDIAKICSLAQMKSLSNGENKLAKPSLVYQVAYNFHLSLPKSKQANFSKKYLLTNLKVLQ